MIFRNAEDGVPYDGIALISGVFRRENAVLPYGCAVGFYFDFRNTVTMEYYGYCCLLLEEKVSRSDG